MKSIRSLTLLTGLLLITTGMYSMRDTLLAESQVVLATQSGDIMGSLILPDVPVPMPVVLCISGSGPTDRDGNNPAMKNDGLKLLAESLSHAGIATVRYDKRGVAGSRGAAIEESALRFDDFVSDARLWVEMLKTDPRFSTITIVGHSEGSLIGMLAAENADKFVSLAGAGQPADAILREQFQKQPQGIRDMALPILDTLSKGSLVENVNPMLNAVFRESVQPYLISWFRYDPRKIISELDIPIMIIQGTNDLQVSVNDAHNLVQAQPEAELVLIDQMNHVLRIVEDDLNANIAAYSNPDLPISLQLQEQLINFIFAAE